LGTGGSRCSRFSSWQTLVFPDGVRFGIVLGALLVYFSRTPNNITNVGPEAEPSLSRGFSLSMARQIDPPHHTRHYLFVSEFSWDVFSYMAVVHGGPFSMHLRRVNICHRSSMPRTSKPSPEMQGQ